MMAALRAWCSFAVWLRGNLYRSHNQKDVTVFKAGEPGTVSIQLEHSNDSMNGAAFSLAST